MNRGDFMARRMCPMKLCPHRYNRHLMVSPTKGECMDCDMDCKSRMMMK